MLWPCSLFMLWPCSLFILWPYSLFMLWLCSQFMLWPCSLFMLCAVCSCCDIPLFRARRFLPWVWSGGLQNMKMTLYAILFMLGKCQLCRGSGNCRWGTIGTQSGNCRWGTIGTQSGNCRWGTIGTQSGNCRWGTIGTQSGIPARLEEKMQWCVSVLD